MAFIVLILLHCNISLKNVTSKTTQAVKRTMPAPLARVLAFLLLAFVTHSATIEIVHQHGSMLSAGSARAASFVGQDADNSSGESARPTGECLICQLHQHLFSTLLIGTHDIAPPQAEEAITRLAFISSLSEACAPSAGRAPPEAALF